MNFGKRTVFGDVQAYDSWGSSKTVLHDLQDVVLALSPAGFHQSFFGTGIDQPFANANFGAGIAANGYGGFGAVVTNPSGTPDIAVQNVRLNGSSFALGDTLTVSYDVANVGDGDATDFGSAHIVISDDATLDAGDLTLGSETYRTIHSGEYDAEDQSYAIPGNLAAGSYWVFVVADPVTGETNAGNNVSAATQITVTTTAPPPPSSGAPDIVVQNVRLNNNSFAVGDTLTLSYDVINVGTGDATNNGRAQVVISDDAILDGGDLTLGSEVFDILTAGAFDYEDQGYAIPASLSPGAYWVFVVADPVAGETATVNNISAATQIAVNDFTIGDDIIVLSPNDDRADGLEGNDTIDALGGDDTICGSAGNDTLNGGKGDDFLSGGDGNDVIDGGKGFDDLFGDAGADTIYGVNGSDTIDGGDGADIIEGNNGDDIVSGGKGSDTINGGKGFDDLSGNDGKDTIEGKKGKDTISGGKGNDTLYGNDGEDVIKGNAGNDVVEGGKGVDTIDGGSGADVLNGRKGKDTVSGGGDNDQVSGNEGDDTLFGNGGDDELYGGKNDDVLDGGADNDTLYGDNGKDTLLGGSGNDVLYGNSGNDVIDGGKGDDMLTGGNSADSFVFSDGADVIVDFEVGLDTIEISAALGVTGEADALALASEVSGDVVFDFGNGDTLTVSNVSDIDLLIGSITVL